MEFFKKFAIAALVRWCLSWLQPDKGLYADVWELFLVIGYPFADVDRRVQ